MHTLFIIWVSICVLCADSDNLPLNGTEHEFAATEALVTQFPYMVFILYRDKGFVTHCSGSLVSVYHVLTAAHCFRKYNYAKFIITAAGAVNYEEYVKKRTQIAWFIDIPANELGFIQERRASSFRFHPNYFRWRTSDVGIITVPKYGLTDYVRPVQITTRAVTLGTKCTRLGFGTTTKNFQLFYAESKEVHKDHTFCGLSAQRPGHFYCIFKGRGQVCAGDGGSPLICDQNLRGVASYRTTVQGATGGCSNVSIEWYVDLSYETEYSFLVSVVNDATNLSSQLLSIIAIFCYILHYL